MAWVVKRDSKAISPALTSKVEGLRWLQRAQGQSADWAIQHEGYSVEEIPDSQKMSNTAVKTIASLKPFRLGEYQTPRWTLTFTDGTMAATEVNSAIGTELHKPEYRAALVHIAMTRKHQVFQVEIIPVPPADILEQPPTVAVVKAYPAYYITGPGREVAEKTECPHGYHLTDSCPGCDYDDDNKA